MQVSGIEEDQRGVEGQLVVRSVADRDWLACGVLWWREMQELGSWRCVEVGIVEQRNIRRVLRDRQKLETQRIGTGLDRQKRHRGGVGQVEVREVEVLRDRQRLETQRIGTGLARWRSEKVIEQKMKNGLSVEKGEREGCILKKGR